MNVDFSEIKLDGQPCCLAHTLANGQAFRWRYDERKSLWRAVVRGTLVELKEENSKLFCRTFPKREIALVRDYLGAENNVRDIYNRIIEGDGHTRQYIDRYYGLRVLNQDPLEALISFLCSTVNSIPRIALSIERLCERYGDAVCNIDGDCYYSFPTCKTLAEADESDLFATGNLCFRGRNIKHVANELLDRGEGWLESLADLDYKEAKNELVSLKHVGEKIADCVCLFSLKKYEAVPVDTHVRQIAQKYYVREMRCKTVTPSVYKCIVDAFGARFGEYAGWAQQFLFYEDIQ